MTRWARLTWQAADPAARAVDLGRRLGVTFAAPPALTDTSPPAGSWVLRLGTADLEVVPWRRESASDAPLAAGRLVFEPIEDGGPDPEPSAAPPLTLVGVAWCTVELERAEAELEPWLVPAPAASATGDEGGGDNGDLVDPHLGARTRVRGAPGLPGGVLVISEPVTEGRLAASLVRDDEGPCALYLRPTGGLAAWIAAARARRVTLSATRSGPFGRSVLLSGSPAAGPHVLLVDAPRPSSAGAPPGTIAP